MTFNRLVIYTILKVINVQKFYRHNVNFILKNGYIWNQYRLKQHKELYVPAIYTASKLSKLLSALMNKQIVYSPVQSDKWRTLQKKKTCSENERETRLHYNTKLLRTTVNRQ